MLILPNQWYACIFYFLDQYEWKCKIFINLFIYGRSVCLMIDYIVNITYICVFADGQISKKSECMVRG